MVAARILAIALVCASLAIGAEAPPPADADAQRQGPAVFERAAMPDFARVGIRLAQFGNEFYVLRATSDRAELLGGRLVAIDDAPIESLRDEARQLRGRNESLRDRGAPAFLERPGLLHAAGLTRAPDRASYRFRMRDGSTREAMLARLTESTDNFTQISALDPAQRHGWASLLSADRIPWSLQEFSTPYRRRDAPELDAIVIQLHIDPDADSQSVVKFLEDSDAARRSAHRKNVILDMRFNGGGNLQLTRNFMRWLPSRLPLDGHIVVLTSPWMSPAAIAGIGTLKRAGGERVTLVGDAPGDRLQFGAETRESLAPDIEAPWTIDAYIDGHDPAMEIAARVLRAC
jgi:hypothetical protein